MNSSGTWPGPWEDSGFQTDPAPICLSVRCDKKHPHRGVEPAFAWKVRGEAGRFRSAYLSIKPPLALPHRSSKAV